MDPTQKPSLSDPIRVVLVDDSAVVRSFTRQFIEEDETLRVVGTAANGQSAIDLLKTTPADVVVLDIEMPVMDGLTALPHILKVAPAAQVIISSTLTQENAVLTMRCLQAGAMECLAKPSAQDMAHATAFKENLVQKVKVLGLVARRKAAARPGLGAVRPVVQPGGESGWVAAVSAPKTFTLRREQVKTPPDVIAIGSSTGGPQALIQFFTDLKTPLRQPVFLTQHMPPTFTAILAEHISKQSGLTCREAQDGEEVKGGVIYMAPGNYHLTVKNAGGRKAVALSQSPPENFCRPAADPMLRSLVEVYGRKVLAVIFTGMGSDGTQGCHKVVEAGGTVLAQDEATSVVWGMPGSVAMAGLCTRVLPLSGLAKAVREYADLPGGPG